MKIPLLSGIALAAIMLLISSHPSLGQTSASGTTRVAQWKDDKKGVFLLMFDDSIPTDVQTVIPELQKRNMIGTFYVNPGSGQWKRFQNDWEKTIPATSMVYADHTMTHKGYTDLAGAEAEIGKGAEAIWAVQPGKDPHLLSYGIPGGVPLKITKDEYEALLARYHLVERPPFGGHAAFINLKDADSILKLADDAIGKGSVQHVVFHGVGGDWLIFPAPEFTKLLDGLVARQNDLWITDHISELKYDTERTTAKVEITQATDAQIRLNLKSDADAQLYDGPLTLITQVPASWKACDVTQGTAKTNVPVKDGVAMFNAIPGSDVITLTSATPVAK